MENFIDPRYFDYAASSPIWQESLDAFSVTAKKYIANPSSQHRCGREAKQELLTLKKTCCDVLQFYDGRLMQCASGSEANNTIIEGHMNRFPEGKIVIAEDVHDSIWYATKKYSKAVNILRIDSDGQLKTSHLERDLGNDITMLCINHVSHETGAIHPAKDIADVCARKGKRILIDGAQSVGHLPIDMNAIPFTYYTFSGHKFGGAKSVGGAFIRDDNFEPLIKGGKQEWNLRAGTEDLAGLSALVSALKKSLDSMNEEGQRLDVLKRSMLKPFMQLPHVIINSPENSLPGILSVSILGMTGSELVALLSHEGFAISTGAACHANEMEPSRIIMAMGRSEKEALGTIRISMGIGTTADAVNQLMKALLDIIK